MSNAAEVEEFLSKLGEIQDCMDSDIDDALRLIWHEGEILGYDTRDKAMDLLANALNSLRELKSISEELLRKHTTH